MNLSTTKAYGRMSNVTTIHNIWFRFFAFRVMLYLALIIFTNLFSADPFSVVCVKLTAHTSWRCHLTDALLDSCVSAAWCKGWHIKFVLFRSSFTFLGKVHVLHHSNFSFLNPAYITWFCKQTQKLWSTFPGFFKCTI